MAAVGRKFYAILRATVIYCAYPPLLRLQPLSPAQSIRMTSIAGKTDLSGLTPQVPIPAHTQSIRPPSTGTWEERWHPLREEWVIIAAHRQSRPWTGASVNGDAESEPPYVFDCYLCPGNARVSGAKNPAYSDIFVFDNDLPCVA